MNRVLVLIIGVILIAFSLLLAIAFTCYAKRIKMAAIIVETSAKFVQENWFISLLPFVLFLIMLVFLTVWILEALGYYSMGIPVTEDKQLPFQHFTSTNFVKIMIVFHIFHLLWVLCFLVESCDFLVSGAAASWYYRKEEPFHASYMRYFRYHVGSVAMGSFLMALFGMLRFLYQLLNP
jgi:hypothetical protein